MMCIMLAAAALSAEPVDDATPEPYPAEILRLKVPPWTPEQYDASYAVMVQNAKLARAEKPHAVAMEKLEGLRIAQYPGPMALGHRRKLYELEVKWIEAEKDRRDRVASQKVVDESANRS